MNIFDHPRAGLFSALLALAAACGAQLAHSVQPDRLPLVSIPAKFIELAATPNTLAQLRQGGYALYLRHAPTDNSKPDRLPAVDLNDCSTQRPLTDEGRALAARVGKAIKAARIPIKSIHISPLCRVKDTAAAAFPGRKVEVDLQLMYTGNLTEGQKAPIVANTRRLLSEPVAPGSNRLVIAHAPNLMELMGYFPKEATPMAWPWASRMGADMPKPVFFEIRPVRS